MFCKVYGFRPTLLIRSTLCLTGLFLLSFASAVATTAYSTPFPFSLPQQAQQPADAIVLELNVPFERELSGQEKHEYLITLTEGQYASVAVEQRGTDLVVQWLGPDGMTIVEFGAKSGLAREKRVELVAETTGAYRLRVEGGQQKSQAGSYSIRFTELRAATEKDRSVQEARRLFLEFVRLLRSGKLSEALTLGQRVLEIREKTLGPEHADVAISLNSLATLHLMRGDYSKADELNRRASEIAEKTLGADPREFAGFLTNVGNAHYLRGDFVKAEQLFRRALEIRERALGPDHADVADSINNLAIIHSNRGDFVTAEELNKRALAIREKTLGPADPLVASSLNNLAIVYRKRGDLVKAEELYERVLKIREKVHGPNHNEVATALNNLAVVHYERRDLVVAERLNQRALEIREKVLPPEHPHIADSLNNLAEVYLLNGDYSRAETLQQRALKIREKALGTQHPEVATSLENLAIIHYQRGDLANAEQLYQRVLGIREKALGPNHPEVAEALSGLATLYAERRDFDRAIATQVKASTITERNIALNLSSGSERQKLAYLAQLSEATDRTLSLHLRAAPDNPLARELGAITVLRRKGRVLDAMSDNRETLRRRLTPQDQALLDRLGDATAQLARLVLNGPQRIAPAEHQQKIKALEEERESIESDLSRRSSGYYDRSVPVTLAAIKDSIPLNAALIEFLVYHPFDPKAAQSDKAYGSPRYVVYVLRRQGEVQWRELGEAKQIDEAVDALRRALRDPGRRDVRRAARQLDERVMRPLRGLLGDATQLLVSPDGALNLIPFEALIDEQSRYLVERYAFTYLTSGRDLLRLQVPRESLSKATVMADPLYGEPEATAVRQGTVTKTKAFGRIAKRQNATTGRDLSDVYFPPLSATSLEARAIKAQFSDVTVMTGSEATESALKRMAAPLLLHIATHGFFLQDGQADSAGTVRSGTRAINANVKIENPLLRSGLALAGANLRHRDDDDGALTALEASGLNLWGTKLVVLSACDTGIGEVKTGEGVYGLRRAFVLAGTESLVMSLWPVSDHVTREMMTNYYKGLRQGRGRGEALRQVQLSMLKQKGREHPFYWASFIQSGEWANLDGRR